ncbi:hypothetical protein [Pedobacter duraquae]|uniref:Thioredoxin-like protein n=1 Tax=Pedobacter duraquae TaxID=425511 RepID=A0A4R6IQP5_9SPHI|nr:hypothetical protein [Pedobacter duraquae]TDO24680.1 hypothetical protein CLV32_0973 [Pedobacter duraquae]
MKKILVVITLTLYVGIAFAQIKFEKTYQEALQSAAAQKRPILIYVLPPHWPPVSPTGKPYVNGMDKPEVVDFYNKNFVVFKTAAGDTAAASIVQQYQLNRFPALLFTDSKGYLLLKNFNGMSFSQPYIDFGKEALAILKSGKTLGDYEARYSSGERSASFLKEFITHKMSLGLMDNSKLIDQYVDFLKISDLSSYNDVLFIFKSGPYIYGKAYTLAYSNKKLADSIYKTEPAADRSAMNAVMRENTMNEAIRTRNNSMARNVFTFLSNIYTNNRAEGYKQASYSQIYYSKAIKDTAQYISVAPYFYDNYYMGLSADSIKRMEKKLVEQRTKIMTENTKQSMVELRKYLPGTIKDSISIKSSSGGNTSASLVATTLNNAAWDVYTLGIKNTNMLIKAMLWSRRAIELSPGAGFYDTMAHIMYRLKLKDEAVLNQDKAVVLAISEKQGLIEVNKMKNEAALMRQGKL